MHRGIPLGLRVLQFLIALTVLALAAAFIGQQALGSAPVTTRYSTFTGGFGMLVCLAGLAPLFVSAVPGIVPVALDAVAGMLFLAGGIAWAVGLKGVQGCTDGLAMLNNDLLNQGSVATGNGVAYGVYKDTNDDQVAYNRLRGNCQRAQADEVLQFILFALALGFVGLGFLQMRKGGTSRGAYIA